MKKVLVVDDDVLIRQMVKRELTKMGYEIESSSDGSLAMNHLQRKCFDMVITDLNMPNLGGLELIRAIRGSGKACSDIPILVITGEETNEMRQAAIDAGATGWVTKPFHPETWRATLIKLLGE